ncbi:hypothetical protein EUGRSUZ_D00482 [Eucalyptus grandis]|uniref:Uncharacterized protein n=2 Tax=Eucalyptus grandis TaxID=71139 RepID=A0ACC3L3K2_EUCGR|nr:hypothetical protein EUGRSUZ_D00482 [Eucalyptus grandis]
MYLHLQGTIEEEEKQTRQMASLEEKIVDQPIVTITRRMDCTAEPGQEADIALNESERQMLAIMEKADGLRLDTREEMVGALPPVHAVDVLAAIRKPHLCIHEWGKRRDHNRGMG